MKAMGMNAKLIADATGLTPQRGVADIIVALPQFIFS